VAGTQDGCHPAIDRDQALFQREGSGEAHGDDTRLSICGINQGLGGAFEANTRQRQTCGPVCLLEEPASRRADLPEAGSHPHFLGALPREDESYLESQLLALALLGLDGKHLLALVGPAVRADVVRKLQRAALGALVHLRHLDAQVASPLSLRGVGDLSLR
jgi:hypothetical protein